jgi:hypothetical protein
MSVGEQTVNARTGRAVAHRVAARTRLAVVSVLAVTASLAAVACTSDAGQPVAAQASAGTAAAGATQTTPTPNPTPTLPPTPVSATSAPATTRQAPTAAPQGATITKTGVTTDGCKPTDDPLTTPGASTRWQVLSSGMPVRAVPNDATSEIGTWSPGTILRAECARGMPVTAAFPGQGSTRYWFRVTSSDGASGWLASGIDGAAPAPN